MCGILGVVGKLDALAFDRQAFESALHLMRERGPDGGGAVYWDRAGFGHRRLSIIDLAGGTQPMKAPDGSSMITYNGEVFNFGELARSLDGEHTPRTRSDTEVVLRGVHQYGSAFLQRLRGMFAFGYYDAATGELLLARDQLGIKPLYYARVSSPAGDTLVFGSEVEPVRQLLGDPDIRMDAMLSYLQYSYVPEPDTVYEGLQVLEPGHLLRYDGERLSIEEYWRPRLGGSKARPEDASDIEATIRTSIDMARVSDVPIASLLSGGIDSAVIASVLRNDASYFNLSFGEGYDESDRAGYTAEHLGIQATFKSVPPAFAAQDVVSLIRKVGQPFGDTSLFACHQIFSTIAETHKVCMSGDGADEIFAGYLMRQVIAFGKVAGFARRIGGKAGKRVARAGLLKIVASYLNHTSLSLSDIFPPSVLEAYEDRYWQAIVRDVDWALEETDDLLNIVSYLVLRRNLPNDMLAKVDRSSMLSSVEVRVPYLDARVVEAGLLLPGSAKQVIDPRLVLSEKRSTTTKLPLRRMLRGQGFSEEFLSSLKKGFGLPAEAWSEHLDQYRPSRDSLVGGLATDAGRDILEQSVFGRLAEVWERDVYRANPGRS